MPLADSPMAREAAPDVQATLYEVAALLTQRLVDAASQFGMAGEEGAAGLPGADRLLVNLNDHADIECSTATIKARPAWEWLLTRCPFHPEAEEPLTPEGEGPLPGIMSRSGWSVALTTGCSCWIRIADSLSSDRNGKR